MRLDKKLNFTQEVDTAKGKVWLHAQPIEAAVFKSYYKVLSLAYTEIFGEGLKHALMSGPRTAAICIEQIARDRDVWENSETKKPDGSVDVVIGVAIGLMNEIVRLANVFAPTPSGWQMMPLDDAMRAGALSAEDADEIRNELAFFTLASWMLPSQDTGPILEQFSKIWNGRVGSSSCSEFQNSLPKSTGTANSGEKPAAA